MEVYGMGTSEWVYEAVGVEKLSQCMFCTFVSHSGNASYSDLCFYCNEIFGCVGLRQKKYSILNTQYDSATYYELKDKLIEHMKHTGEWGMFFPSTCSPFAYNETVAHERYPLEKNQALALGFRWRDSDPQPQVGAPADLPDDSLETPQSITQSTLICQESGKLFKINGPEYNFYISQKLPIPRISADARYARRMRRR